jgi:hypothetical protein
VLGPFLVVIGAIARRYLWDTSMAELDAPRDTDEQQPAIAG